MFKVLQLNVLSDMTFWKDRRPLIVAQAAPLQPDFVTLQEVNIENNVHLWIADKLELPYVELAPRTGEASSFEGLAILSRYPFQEKEILKLISQDRVAQYVRVDVDGHPLVIGNGHFYLEPGPSHERQLQIRRVHEWLPKDRYPTLLCGDFNSSPDSPSIQHMKNHMTSAHEAVHGQEPDKTSPTGLPSGPLYTLENLAKYAPRINPLEMDNYINETLDYIFFNQRLRPLDARRVLDEHAPDNPELYASDHFGLYAEFEFAE